MFSSVVNPTYRQFGRLLLCALVLAITGCTSSLVVRTLYADLGDRSADRFKDYADFNERQDQWIDDRASQFHRWHRATQLPLYAVELKRLGAQLDGQNTLSVEAIRNLERTVRDLSENIRLCHPVNQATTFLSKLSDSQVVQIDRHMRKQHRKFRKRYEDETAEERVQRRVANITKWSGRLGATFNQPQRDLLVNTLRKQHSLGEQRLQQRSLWLDRFNANLQQRNSTQFADTLQVLLEEQWRGTEREHPEQWRENEALWTRFLQDFLSLQSRAQRDTMLKRIDKFANIISSMGGNRVAATTRSCH